ncbi:hypothetical protein ANCCEY_12684 [Ancylostoma ceylanicum]|uniref:SAM domain-containing protein n=1 Tax=Ancylostoma ceylanicum TaxID=53326 RepID=A0A0D6L950_9BILA|nr:hypothetical protein ANCCEY_12684 [Ancylostoma ceylanicum]
MQLIDSVLISEEDALECCHWLRQAGFPQYAKQYQEGRFPIDIRSVQSDHEFLGPDSLRALYRRLNTLNRCAIMRIDQVVLRRRNDDYSYGMYDGFDDDDSLEAEFITPTLLNPILRVAVFI